jgi:8-amino-7-oxononanoate synthase
MNLRDLAPRLKALEDSDLLRAARVLTTAPQARVKLEGRSVLNFASNNYLGLAADPRLVQAAHEALREWGVGATASRLLGGTLEIHASLEEALARFKGTEAAAVFPSGYHVNTGLLPALLDPEDVVLADRLCHASLIDGARLSRAALRVFRHNDMADLEKALKRAPGRGARWVVTESVFSMDGDLAPLSELVSLAQRTGARTYVDEAHATGVVGPEGRGLVQALGLEKDVDVCMGTLSKALGGLGGFVCGSRDLVSWIHNRCRSFIYSTALPPALAAAALAALDICRREDARRDKLARLANRLRRELGLPPGESPIVPFVVGSETDALRAAAGLWETGVFAPAIRPPTVPKGTSRLRFSVTADHEDADIDRVIAFFRKPVAQARS